MAQPSGNALHHSLANDLVSSNTYVQFPTYFFIVVHEISVADLGFIGFKSVLPESLNILGSRPR